MSKEKRRVPKLRFPGFTEDWEQRKLSEVVTINPKTELPDKFKYVDLESVVGTNLLGFQVIKKENAPSRAQRLASYGDVFYQTVRPYQRNNYLFENIDKDMVFSTGYAQLRSKLDSYFLLTLVQNDNFVKVVLDNCTGTSYPAINGSELGKITVQIPSNDEEANQIGKVFRGIDNIITLHQRKLDNLKLKKKALLQKLFPKNGERYPELRFPGFTDAWEQRKFSEIYERAGQKNDLTYGIDKIISVANMYFKKDVTVGSEEYLKTYNVFKLGDIAFEGHTNKEYRYGRFVENTIGDGIVSHIFDVFTPKINLDINFWKDLIKYEPIMGPILRRCTKASRMMSNLTTKEFLEEQILCPTLEEQKLIGEFIVSLDKNITLHQRKLDHLQLQKKALLQQMFV